MGFTEKIIRKCPYCNFESSLKQFVSWEKNGKRGYLGKDTEKFIMLLCPECENHIRYDPLSGKFYRLGQRPLSGIIFNLVF